MSGSSDIPELTNDTVDQILAALEEECEDETGGAQPAEEEKEDVGSNVHSGSATEEEKEPDGDVQAVSETDEGKQEDPKHGGDEEEASGQETAAETGESKSEEVE